MSELRTYDGPIIDAHQHFWNPFVNRHPWLSGAPLNAFRYGDYTAIRRRYYPDDYFVDSARHDVRETVYVEAEWDPRDPIGETAFVSALAARYGVPNAIVAQAWLHHDDAGEVLTRQASFALVRSVRHKPGGADRPEDATRTRSLMSDERWRRGFAALETHGLHFDLQTPWWHAGEAALLARDFPHTTIIVNHAGLPGDRSRAGLQAWHEAMGRLADFSNVMMKISGIGQRGQPWTVQANDWIVRECIAMFTPQRVMFASNFPVDSLCATFDCIYSGFKAITANFPAPDQSAMFYGNARRIYRTVHQATLRSNLQF